MASRLHRFSFTEQERSVLTFAAGMAGEDLDSLGLTAAEKRAYSRVMSRLRSVPGTGRLAAPVPGPGQDKAYNDGQEKR